MKTIAVVAGVLVILAYAILQFVAGFEGIEYHMGKWWAIGAIVAAFTLRFMLPITLGAFFGAMDVWGWSWPVALVFAAPGLFVAVPALAGDAYEFLAGLWHRRKTITSKRFPEPESDAESINDHVKTGVGGWLGLLVVGLVFLGPLLGAGRIYADILAAENQTPELLNIARWAQFKTSSWWCFAVICLISISTGLRLYSSRRMAIINQTILALWVMGPVGVFVMNVAIPIAVFGKTLPMPETIAILLSASLPAFVWSWYLLKSKRVQYTYIL